MVQGNVRAHLHLDGAFFHDALTEAITEIVKKKTGIDYPIQSIKFWGDGGSQSLTMAQLKTISVDIDQDIEIK